MLAGAGAKCYNSGMNERMTGAAEAALRRAGALRGDAVLLVALSGGADSVCLLFTVKAMAGRYGFAVRAAHVEHGLRGDASLADARFCERLCARLGVPFSCDHAALEGGMAAPGAEARAREARYALLLRRARECGADALLLAHHRDDQAETVLAHLLRGSGARGLGGMREVSVLDGVTVVRPLLTVSKREILAALAEADEPFCRDESNALLCCQRNRLRAETLPALERENPRAAEHMAQSARLLQMDEDCLQAQADALLLSALYDRPPFFFLTKAALLAAPEAVAVRAIRRFAERGTELAGFPAEPDVGPEERSLSAEQSLALLDLLRAPDGGSVNLPRGLRACATARRLHLLRMEDGFPLTSVPVPPPATGLSRRRTVRYGALMFRLSPCGAADSPPDGLRSVVVPDALLASATLRASRPGDRILPFGASGGKPLRRYFTDRKVDAPFRPFVPVLCTGCEALWAAGVGAAEGTRGTGDPSTRITVRGPMPWLDGAR